MIPDQTKGHDFQKFQAAMLEIVTQLRKQEIPMLIRLINIW